MGMTKEVVEFVEEGLDKIEKQVKDTEAAIKQMRNSNSELRKQMRDGSWERESKKLAGFRRELREVRREQDAIYASARRQSYVARYGRVGGNAAYFGSRAASAISSGFGSIQGAAIGGAAALGVSFGVSSLASRGFSGTQHEASLQNALDRLSRTVARDLTPVMSGLTKVIDKVASAREMVRAGKGSPGDWATTATAYGAAGITAAGGAVGVGSWIKNQFTTAAPQWALAAGVAGRAGMRTAGSVAGRASPYAAAAMGLYDIYDASTRSTLSSSNDTRSRYQQKLDRGNEIADASAGGRFARNTWRALGVDVRSPQRRAEDEGVDEDKRGWWTRTQDNADDWMEKYGPSYYSWVKKGWQQVGVDIRSDQRKKKVEGGSTVENLKYVAGAGERRGLTDIYEELAAAIPTQMLGASGTGGGGNGPLSILEEILGVGKQILGEMTRKN